MRAGPTWMLNLFMRVGSTAPAEAKVSYDSEYVLQSDFWRAVAHRRRLTT